MNALSKHPHLDPHIYESAAEFSERGAAVGLSVNAQRALSEIGEPVRKALDNAGAVEMHSSRQMLVRKSQHFDIMTFKYCSRGYDSTCATGEKLRVGATDVHGDRELAQKPDKSYST